MRNERGPLAAVVDRGHCWRMAGSGCEIAGLEDLFWALGIFWEVVMTWVSFRCKSTVFRLI